MKETFIFYKSWYEAIRILPKKNHGEILEAIVEYGINGNIIESKNPIVKAILAMVIPQINSNLKKFENGQKGNEFGKLGGRPKKETEKKTMGLSEQDPQNPSGVSKNIEDKTPVGLTTETPNVYVNDNVNVNDNDDDNGTSPSPPSKIEEEIQEMKNDAIWHESICMKFKIGKPKLYELLDEFALYCRCKGMPEHKGRIDARTHFCSWMNKKETEKNEKNRQDNNVQRRGTDAVSDKPKNYKASF